VADLRTPAAWLETLDQRLNARWLARRVGMGVCDAYYEGDHRLAFATGKFREAFGALFAAIADNWMQIVVDSKAERLEVQGFRFGKRPGADTAAWDIWQANGLDAEHKMVQTEAIKLGEAYWLVEPPAPGSSDPPRITGEHPSQTIVACAPGDSRRRLAALKKWVDDDGYIYANVYLPDGIAKFRSVEKARAGQRVQWARRQDDPGGAHDLGEVPVIPIRNNPSMLRGGRSDIAVGIPIQDALNKLLSDMLIGSEYQAFPQRVLLGVEIPADPATGQPVTAAQLQASQSRLWAFANPDAKVAEFNAANLDNYVNARQHLVRGLTAKTRTPPHYVLGEIINASGDALSAAESGLVAKARDTMAPFGEGHEDAVRLSFRAIGDEQRAKVDDSETIWRNPEHRSEAQSVDAAVKLKQVNLPDEVLWERIGMSPQEIERAKTLQLIDGVFAPISPPPPAAGVADTAPGQTQAA
jgi:hypothetical protein